MDFRSPTAGRRRWGIFLLVAASAAALALVTIVAAWNRSDTGPGPAKKTDVGDAAWEPTSEGDFEERAAGFSGRRLRLRAATRHTRTDTVKFLGVRRREEIRLTPGARIAVDLDWNNQANGSGMTAGIVLAPISSTANPFILPDCLTVEFIGVPPGKNVRRVIGSRQHGHHHHLDSEGWPHENRVGRPITTLRIEIVVGEDGAFKIFENDAEIFASAAKAVPFDRAYLYLQMSSKPNYPPREVFFDNVVVQNGK